MATAKKLLGNVGVPALCGHVKSIKQTADAAATGVIQLSNALNQSVSEIEEALNDVPIAHSVTIPANGWTYNSSLGDYSYYYDITATGVTANDLPVVSVAPSSLSTTANCELCPTCESLANAIRVYTKYVPDSAITVSWWAIEGKAAS